MDECEREVVKDIVPLPGSYLHNDFEVQTESFRGDVSITDIGAPCHMTHNKDNVYDLRPSPAGRETITIGDRRKLRVEYMGNTYVFHWNMSE